MYSTDLRENLRQFFRDSEDSKRVEDALEEGRESDDRFVLTFLRASAPPMTWSLLYNYLEMNQKRDKDYTELRLTAHREAARNALVNQCEREIELAGAEVFTVCQ